MKAIAEGIKEEGKKEKLPSEWREKEKREVTLTPRSPATWKKEEKGGEEEIGHRRKGEEGEKDAKY